MFVNDLDVLDEDTVFFTDSSSKWDRRRFPHPFLEQLPNGRVLKLSKDKKSGRWTSEVIFQGFYFANGLQIHPDRQSMLVADCSMARIWRLYFDGPKKGKREIFVENLPGFPDNIRLSSSSKTLFVGLAGLRHADEFSLFDSLGEAVWIRKLSRLIPDRFLAKVFTLVKKKHGFVVELDVNGEVVSTLQDPEGLVVTDVSQATPDEEGTFLYLGSFHADYIAKVAIRKKQRN